MEELKKTITETMQMAEETAALFYQQKNKEGLQILETVIGKIMNTITEIINYQAEHNIKIFEDRIFNIILTEAMKAIENKDMVLFADLLVYEINDVLDGCYQQL